MENEKSVEPVANESEKHLFAVTNDKSLIPIFPTVDCDVLIVSSTTWTQLTTNTATPEELANDPNLVNSWCCDIPFDCTSEEAIELIPNVPTSQMGLAYYNNSLNGFIRLYAGANLTGQAIQFTVANKRKRNEVV